mgnify:FL=1
MSDWYKIRMVAPRIADVDILSDIGGWWDGVDAATMVHEIRDLDVDEIRLNINSGGGSIFDAVAILNALRQHPAKVTATVLGLAASAASFIACGVDDLMMSANSTMMIHDGSGIAVGNAQDMHEMADLLDKLSDNIASIYAGKAGGTPDSWRDTMRAETWYTADEAVAAGLADGVIDAAKAEPPEAASTAENRAHPATVEDARRALALSASLTEQDRGRGPRIWMQIVPASTEPGQQLEKEEAVDHTEFLTSLRARLGVTDADATEETILAALDESLAEQPQPAVDMQVPEGTVLVDKGQWEQVKQDAEAGRQARAEQVTARRDALIADALREGRISPANSEAYRAMLDVDEERAARVLSALQPNTAVPVAEIGHAGGQGDEVAAVDDAYPSNWITK